MSHSNDPDAPVPPVAIPLGGKLIKVAKVFPLNPLRSNKRVVQLKNGRIAELVVDRPRHYPTPDRHAEIWEQVRELRHPGIVRIHDWIEAEGPDGSYWAGFVREHLHLISPSDPSHPARSNLRGLIEFGIQLCETLAVVHARNLVHLDLKPDNIGFRRKDGMRPVIFDWDLVRTIGSFSSETQDKDNRTISCTPSFASPEQVMRRPIGAESDVFSLAVTLLSLATKTLGFGHHHRERPQGISDERWAERQTSAALESVVHDPLPAMGMLEAFPSAVISVFGRALDKNAKTRTPSANTFAQDLGNLLTTLSPKELDRPFFGPTPSQEPAPDIHMSLVV